MKWARVARKQKVDPDYDEDGAESFEVPSLFNWWEFLEYKKWDQETLDRQPDDYVSAQHRLWLLKGQYGLLAPS